MTLALIQTRFIAMKGFPFHILTVALLLFPTSDDSFSRAGYRSFVLREHGRRGHRSAINSRLNSVRKLAAILRVRALQLLDQLLKAVRFAALRGQCG